MHYCCQLYSTPSRSQSSCGEKKPKLVKVNIFNRNRYDFLEPSYPAADRIKEGSGSERERLWQTGRERKKWIWSRVRVEGGLLNLEQQLWAKTNRPFLFFLSWLEMGWLLSSGKKHLSIPHCLTSLPTHTPCLSPSHSVRLCVTLNKKETFFYFSNVGIIFSMIM